MAWYASELPTDYCKLSLEKEEKNENLVDNFVRCTSYSLMKRNLVVFFYIPLREKNLENAKKNIFIEVNLTCLTF